MGCCGDNEFVRGGVITEATITKSDIQNSTISGSTIDGCTIEKLAGIDSASAKTIADALGRLTPEQLASLAKAVAAAIAPLPGKAPETTQTPELPVTLYGARTAMLGAPVRWMSIDGFVVPAYNGGE